MKVLTAVLVYRGHEHTEACLNRLIGQSDLLILDNGSDLQELIKNYDCFKMVNKKNLLVNPAFNQVMKYFLKGDWDKLVIVNSDFILSEGWINCVKFNFIPIPGDPATNKLELVTAGTPGVFMCLTRKMVKAVYPLPDYIKVWFADDWIFSILRGLGHQTIVLPELNGEHYQSGSQDIMQTPGIYDLIEEDKKQWALYGRLDMLERIGKAKGGHPICSK